jgi:hypothetical protein
MQFWVRKSPGRYDNLDYDYDNLRPIPLNRLV